jgi:hypothetical protein
MGMRRFVFTCVVNIDERILSLESSTIEESTLLDSITKDIRDEVSEVLYSLEEQEELEDIPERLTRVIDAELKEIPCSPTSRSATSATQDAPVTSASSAGGAPSTAAAGTSPPQRGLRSTDIVPFETRMWTLQGNEVKAVGPVFADSLGISVYCVHVDRELEPAVRFDVQQLLGYDPSMPAQRPATFSQFQCTATYFAELESAPGVGELSGDEPHPGFQYWGGWYVERRDGEWVTSDPGIDFYVHSPSLEWVERELYEWMLREKKL